jgi:hypothetical protein
VALRMQQRQTQRPSQELSALVLPRWPGMLLCVVFCEACSALRSSLGSFLRGAAWTASEALMRIGLL